MQKTDDQMKRLGTLLGITLMATVEALAQENQARSARWIVISLPDRKLAVIEAGRVLKVFPTAVGAPRTPSPTGCYRIIQRLSNPTWYTKGRIVPPGSANPLGTRWLGLSAKGYGIHGTNSPRSIGASVSHGCIRMRNRDVEQLFAMVAIGDAVELYSERTPELAAIFGTPANAPAGAQAVAGAVQ
jgi:lipoprotein-anchoring transpeptidase ErfK/SrfK